jgi:hypothetical protein
MNGGFSLGFRDVWNGGFEQEIYCSGKEPLNQNGIVSPLVRQLPWSHHLITQEKAPGCAKEGSEERGELSG